MNQTDERKPLNDKMNKAEILKELSWAEPESCSKWRSIKNQFDEMEFWKNQSDNCESSRRRIHTLESIRNQTDKLEPFKALKLIGVNL